ncbi:hypothetical protein AB3R30_14160, partial [Leptolyngbyaceae cyanobacterium UHCC 1019]
MITSLGFMVADQLPASAASLTPANVSIVDGDFANWDVFHLITDNPYAFGSPSNLSTGVGQRLETGGSPGAFLQLSHIFVFEDTSWVGGIKTDATYNPIIDGEILSLSATATVKSGGVSAWQVVVEQAGQRYFSFPFRTISAGSGDWQSVSIANLTANDFDTNPWAGMAMQLPNGNSPNFGAGAAPIDFGFLFGNRTLGSTAINIFGLDNFALTISPGAPSQNVDSPAETVPEVSPPPAEATISPGAPSQNVDSPAETVPEVSPPPAD